MTNRSTPVVLVLMGGPDAEHAVSLESGTAVADALSTLDAFQVERQIIEGTNVDPHQLRAADVVFPVLHGPWGEGGPLQELLEAYGRPYVGSGPQTAAIAMDKLATKSRLATAGIPTPPAAELDVAGVCPISPPLVLKPIDDGSSFDLAICRSPRELDEARHRLHPRRPRLMAERYIAGREITASLVEGHALPLIEIVPAVEFYDYDAKYVRDDTGYLINPDLEPDIHRQITEYAHIAGRNLGCRDLARVDFMLDEDGPWLLEVNTMPGFTAYSLVPKAAAAVGLSLAELCRTLVTSALARSVEQSRS